MSNQIFLGLKKKKGFREIQDLSEHHIGTFRKLLPITSSRRLGVKLMGLLGYGTVLQPSSKIILTSWVFKREFAPIFRPKLMISV
jgi:hypothetical protein